MQVLMYAEMVYIMWHRENILQAPAWIDSYAANAFQHNGTQYSINSAYWGPASLTQARQQQTYAAHMASLAVPGRE